MTSERIKPNREFNGRSQTTTLSGLHSNQATSGSEKVELVVRFRRQGLHHQSRKGNGDGSKDKKFHRHTNRECDDFSSLGRSALYRPLRILNPATPTRRSTGTGTCSPITNPRSPSTNAEDRAAMLPGPEAQGSELETQAGGECCTRSRRWSCRTSSC